MIVDTGVEFLVDLLDVVLLATLGKADFECPLFLVGEGANVQPTSVVWAWVQHKDVVVDHDLSLVVSARHTVFLGIDFGWNAGFLVNQQKPEP